MLANRGQEIFVETSLRQEKQGGVCAQRFSAAGCFANSGKSLDCESSGNRGFGRSREGTDLGEQVLESLVAHRLIDLGSEWHLLRHRYKHSAWEIYWRRRCAGIKKASYIAAWTHS
jgi:hypothetical protein